MHTIAGAGLWALYYGEATTQKGVDFDAITVAACGRELEPVTAM